LRGARSVNALTVKGVEAFKQRLAAKGLEEATGKMLASEAETVRASAARATPGRLGKTLKTIEESNGDRLCFAIGTPHRAGRFLEFGTRQMRARPFLWPVFRARLPRIKQDLTNTLHAPLAKQ